MRPGDPRDPWPYLEGSPEFAEAMRQAAKDEWKPFVHRVPKPRPSLLTRLWHRIWSRG